jgi:murein DD-endopeptidase MepM/ murein hydrolase activator NlpD
VHSAGYNEGHGDYGNVVVIEHQLSSGTKIYALYGHLDRTSIKGKKSGTKIKKGQVIGRLGDLHENGGWVEPHCHFQLSTRPPETHDMPGAASVDDRKRALINYPDPRLVLGNIY